MSEVDFTPPENAINVEIPQPLNWKILVEPLAALTHSVEGIEFTEKTQQDQEFITTVGKVIAMGASAYSLNKLDDANNPTIGSWVLYPTYGGQRIEMADGRVYQLMNDDHVIAVVKDPSLYRKKII